MSKTSAIIQIIIILAIVGLSTYYFFKGNFEVGLSFLPFLMLYYIFVTARRKRAESRESRDQEDPE
jgi:hypothetical protein